MHGSFRRYTMNAHARLSTARGMCTDELAHHVIDAMIGKGLDDVYALEAENRRLIDDRDRWIRLFNAMENAITHHKSAYISGNQHYFTESQDEALWKARDKILKEASDA